MPDLIITPDVVERCARAMYTASLADAGPHRARAHADHAIPTGNRRLRAWVS